MPKNHICEADNVYEETIIGCRFIYLDVSFLSQLAKADIAKSDTSIWVKLLAALRRQVETGKSICPAWMHNLDEVELAPRLVEPVTRIEHELSRGFSFRCWWEIATRQTAKSYLDYLERSENVMRGWRAIVKRDYTPALPACVTQEGKRFYEKMTSVPVQASGKIGSFYDEYNLQRCDLIRQLLRDSFLDFEQPGGHLISFTEMVSREAGLLQEELPPAFWKSSHAKGIEYIHIVCSLFASLETNEATRRSRGGDIFDVCALASVIPYCDIVTMDKNMKAHVVDRLRLDVKYNTRVFSAADLLKFLDLISTT